MKKILTTIFLLVAAFAQAATYYISNSGNTTNAGTSPAAPWNYAKLQAEISKTSSPYAINAGDFILFNRGEEFYGGMTVNRSGTVIAKISFGTYGTGAKPVISGMKHITAWTSLGNGIYESTGRESDLGGLLMLTINGRTTTMARYPNASTSSTNNYGLLKADSTSVLYNQVIALPATLPLSPSMVGSQIVIRPERFLWDTGRVTSQVNYQDSAGKNWTVISTANKMAGQQQKGWGFFFQDRPEYIDVNNEWWYDRANGKVRIKLASAPSNYVIKITTVQTLFAATSRSYYNFEDIVFEGANGNAVWLRGNSFDYTFNRIDFRYCGHKGIEGKISNVGPVNIDYCSFTDINNYGADFSRAEGGRVSCTNSEFRRIGLDVGMHTADGQMATGFRMGHHANYFAHNYMDSIGSIGVRWHGPGTIVEYNYFSNFCMTSDDNGAIYSSNTSTKAGAEVRYNVVDGSRAGQPFAGTNSGSYQVYGIYLDDASRSDSLALNPLKVHHNIVKGCPWGGIYAHNNYGVSYYNNIGFFNERLQFQSVNDRRVVGTNAAVQGQILDDTTAMHVVKHNIFVARKTSDFAVRYQSLHTDTGYLHPLRRIDEPNWVKTRAEYESNLYNGIDSNYYMRPASNESKIVYASVNIYRSGSKALPWPELYFTIPQWTAYAGHDANSKGSPVVFTDTADLNNLDKVVKLVYNYTPRDSFVNFTRSWKTHDGKIIYPGNYTLDPYEALVLLKFDAAPPINPDPEPTPDPDPVVTPPSGNDNLPIAWGEPIPVSKNGKLVKYDGKIVVIRQPIYRQNLFTYSEEFDNAVWLKSAGVTVAANAGDMAPDGTETADRASTVVGVNASKNITQPGAAVKDSIYTLSIYAKNVSRQYIQLGFGLAGFGTGSYANFDLVAGTRTYAGATLISSSIEPVTNFPGWYLCRITAKATATASSGVNNFFSLVANGRAGRAYIYTSSVVTSIDLWGAQYAKQKPRPYSKTTTTAIQ